MKKVLVIGDVILDEYHYVTTERRAQEEDIPVYDLIRTETRLGGAGNVAANIKALDSDIYVSLSCVADGDTRSLIISNGLDCYCAYGPPIKKTRLINRDKIVTRLDSKRVIDESRVGMLEDMIVSSSLDEFNYDLIVISDYNKGTITKAIVDKLLTLSIPIIVDSKRFDLSMFKGCTFLNINLEEYSKQSSTKQYIVESLFNSIIVTKGCEPTRHIQYEPTQDKKSYITHTEDFPVDKAEALDVTGCGDTHTAAFAVGYLRDKEDIRNAIRYANSCASIAVTKQGTAKVTKWDFLKSLDKEA